MSLKSKRKCTSLPRSSIAFIMDGWYIFRVVVVAFVVADMDIVVVIVKDNDNKYVVVLLVCRCYTTQL